MTIQKKSLISTLNTTKKAMVANSPVTGSTSPASVKAGRLRAGAGKRLATVKAGTLRTGAKKTGWKKLAVMH